MIQIHDIHHRIKTYYSEKIVEHGAVARGADWKDEFGQTLRFEKLAELFRGEQTPSIVQLGCGYGAFIDFCDNAGDRPPLSGPVGMLV